MRSTSIHLKVKGERHWETECPLLSASLFLQKRDHRWISLNSMLLLWYGNCFGTKCLGCQSRFSELTIYHIANLQTKKESCGKMGALMPIASCGNSTQRAPSSDLVVWTFLFSPKGWRHEEAGHDACEEQKEGLSCCVSSCRELGSSPLAPRKVSVKHEHGPCTCWSRHELDGSVLLRNLRQRFGGRPISGLGGRRIAFERHDGRGHKFSL